MGFELESGAREERGRFRDVKDVLKAARWETTSEKALTDTSKFVFGLRPKANLLVSVSALSKDVSRLRIAPRSQELAAP